MTDLPPFPEFPKIPRLNREMIVKEKIDGTNALIYVTETAEVFAGSKNQWITPETDNFGFAKWVKEHSGELIQLGPGFHRGEWHGSGVNKNRYQLQDKRFALFEHRFHDDWKDKLPACCTVVPILYKGPFSTEVINIEVALQRSMGSTMYPGKPSEGVVVWLPAAQQGFKVTCHNDEMSKGEADARAKHG